MDYACPRLICPFSMHLCWEIWCNSFFLDSSFGSHFWPLPSPSIFFHLVPSSTVVDLRPPRIAQSAKLWLIHHVKYPLAFHSLSVDYSNDCSLIFRIRRQACLLINLLYPTTLSSCTKPPDVCSCVS